VGSAVASGLNAVYAVSAALGLAGGIIVLALVRPARGVPDPEPARERAAAA
jgi:hypothetical protein